MQIEPGSFMRPMQCAFSPNGGGQGGGVPERAAKDAALARCSGFPRRGKG